jgi:integrase
LYLQVLDTGARSWVLKFVLFGRRHEMGLGSAKTYTLDDARERARKYRKLVDDGLNPIEHRDREKQQRRVEAGQRKTFEEAAREYVRLHQGRWRNAKHAQQWTNTLQVHVYPLIGERDVDTITKADVLTVLEPIASEKAETASRIRQRIRAVLDWSAARDWRRNHNPAMWDEIAHALPIVPKKKRTKHFAACAYAAVPATVLAVRESTATELVKLMFEFTVLTAARSGEVRGMCWGEVDTKTKTWIVPPQRMKAGREQRVPLTERAVAILKRAHKLTEQHGAGDLVFPNGKGKAYSDMVFTALLRRLKYEFTMHGFRSSFRDWAAETTAHPRDVIEAALAHQLENATEAAYFRSDLFEKRRVLMDDWARHCAGGAA